MSNKREILGRLGEDLAISHLKKKGYTILTRNYRQKCGEIDIIAEENGVLAFIEVKTRKSVAFGPPFAAVTEKKQRQIGRVAQDYLSRTGQFNRSARFDVVSILMDGVHPPIIELLTNAFELR